MVEHLVPDTVINLRNEDGGKDESEETSLVMHINSGTRQAVDVGKRKFPEYESGIFVSL